MSFCHYQWWICARAFGGMSLWELFSHDFCEVFFKLHVAFSRAVFINASFSYVKCIMVLTFSSKDKTSNWLYEMVSVCFNNNLECLLTAAKLKRWLTEALTEAVGRRHGFNTGAILSTGHIDRICALVDTGHRLPVPLVTIKTGETQIAFKGDFSCRPDSRFHLLEIIMIAFLFSKWDDKLQSHQVTVMPNYSDS